MLEAVGVAAAPVGTSGGAESAVGVPTLVTQSAPSAVELLPPSGVAMGAGGAGRKELPGEGVGACAPFVPSASSDVVPSSEETNEVDCESGFL